MHGGSTEPEGRPLQDADQGKSLYLEWFYIRRKLKHRITASRPAPDIGAKGPEWDENRFAPPRLSGPLSVQSGDFRRYAREWARRAVSGRSAEPDRVTGFDPKGSLH